MLTAKRLPPRESGELWDEAGHKRLRNPLDPSQGPMHLMLSQCKELKGPGPCTTSKSSLQHHPTSQGSHRIVWVFVHCHSVPFPVQSHTLHHSAHVGSDQHHTPPLSFQWCFWKNLACMLFQVTDLGFIPQRSPVL